MEKTPFGQNSYEYERARAKTLSDDILRSEASLAYLNEATVFPTYYQALKDEFNARGFKPAFPVDHEN